MKKAILGILLGLCVMTCPITADAHERQCPQPLNITEQEAQELLRIAWIEAGNQGVTGQAYIMSVILNRVKDPAWPKTIHEVIYQAGQFATGRMATAQPTWETHYALAEIEMGNIYPDIIGFERVNSTVLDSYFTQSFTYKDHKFYVNN